MDNNKAFDADKEEKQEFKEPEREAPKKPENLPSSEDKEFWGEGARINKINKNSLQAPDMSKHQLIHTGYEIICVGCPFSHSISVDPAKFNVIDGKLTPKIT